MNPDRAKVKFLAPKILGGQKRAEIFRFSVSMENRIFNLCFNNTSVFHPEKLFYFFRGGAIVLRRDRRRGGQILGPKTLCDKYTVLQNSEIGTL